MIRLYLKEYLRGKNVDHIDVQDFLEQSKKLKGWNKLWNGRLEDPEFLSRIEAKVEEIYPSVQKSLNENI